MIRNSLQLLAFLAVLWVSHPAFADHEDVVDVVEARLSSGKMASANFHVGKSDQPAVLILHGFLQTRAFPTVASVTEALSTAGFTTLAPTLSLGISHRNKSLPCEAVHLHALDDDVAEVAFWVHWLMQKGHSRIILVGHSFGNLQLLAYLEHAPTPAVKQVLMISLTDVEVKQSAQQRDLLAKDMRERVSRRDKRLAEAEFGLCRKYVSPPAALLSYLSISRGSILDALSQTRVPVEVIMGGKDDRMGSDWVGKLISRGIVVRVIPGASHFFDNQYEFDLQEAVLQAVRDRLPVH
jgi:pimeloyl-ACP methyl ester carboxylesterase